MTLSDTARDRLDDVRELEPTTNGELRERWGMDSGSDVHRYLESELGEHVTRGDDGKIRVDGEGPQADPEPTQGGVGGRSGTSKAEQDPQPSEPNGGSSTATTSPSAARDGAQDRTVEMTPEEMDRTIEAAVEAATEDVGREQASTTATQSSQVVEETEPATGEQHADRPSQGANHSGNRQKPLPPIPDLCPRCGSSIDDGDTFEAEITRMADDGLPQAKQFINSNDGADPRYACEDWLGCGHYMTASGDRRTFETPAEA